MAYMDQERKAAIAAELKKVMPKDWKWSLSVKHHSTIVLTVSEAPVDLVAEYNETMKKRNPEYAGWGNGYVQVNEHWLQNQFVDERLEQMEAIRDALNVGNWDKSDIQTDYFNVGWYVSINFGRWNKPFKATEKIEKEAA